MKAIVYLNQFFGQIGGEEEADLRPLIREGPVGPALAMQEALGGQVEVTHTLIAGDNYMSSSGQEALEETLALIEGKAPDIFFAGPAFRAGRYGISCGKICKAIQDKYEIPVLTSMNVENPGLALYRSNILVFKGGASAASMKRDVAAMTTYALKLLNGEPLLPAGQECYFGRGSRRQYWPDPPVAAVDRVLSMLSKKIQGLPFTSELEIPKFEHTPIAPALTADELSRSKVALITTGGIVPAGNPDRIQSASATRWGKYDIKAREGLMKGDYLTIHAGFDPGAANNDPHVILPLDALLAHQKEGKIGAVYNYFFSTVGTGTTQAEAARMGSEMAEQLKKDGIRAAILTST